MDKHSGVMVRKCLVCGKRIRIKLIGRKYDNGHYFGRVRFPIEGTGKYKKTGSFKLSGMKCPVVRWTGRSEEVEYWECNECYELAGHLSWLENTVEKNYGKRCKKRDSGCACCQAWDVYDSICKEAGE